VERVHPIQHKAVTVCQKKSFSSLFILL